MVIILPTIILMSYTDPIETLVNTKPSGSLINIVTFASLFVQLFISLGVQSFILWFLTKQSWFEPLQPLQDSKQNVQCQETTSVFILTCFQTLGSALAFSISKPFKKPIYTNKPYMFVLLLLFGLTTYITFSPDEWTRNYLKQAVLPRSFQAILLVLGYLQVIVFYMFEYFFVASAGRKLLTKIDFRKLYNQKLYKKLRQEMGLQSTHSNQL
jgi:cation-transporting ATPase 13A2